jgi:hypothetical protein
MSSRPRFHVEVLKEMSDAAPSQKFTVGNLSLQDNKTVSYNIDRAGSWKVYDQPEHDSKYVIGVDTCTGEDQQMQGLAADPDYHSVQVWRAPYEDWNGDWHVARMVAVHHSRVDIGVLSEEIIAVAQWYGGAFVVPEVNNTGLAVVKYLLEAGVSVYQRRKINNSTGMVEKFFGWQTDKVTRKTLIDHMAAELMDRNFDIPDPDILHEMKVFVINEKGKPEAAPGHHDDHVLSSALAIYNIDSATSYRGHKKKKITTRMLRKNPSLMCPDGFMRVPLSEYKRLRR